MPSRTLAGPVGATVATLLAAVVMVACSSSRHGQARSTSSAATVRQSTSAPALITAPASAPASLAAGVRFTSVDVGAAPATFAFGFGSVWVGSHRGTQLYRLDPTTGRVTASISVGADPCSAVVGDRFVYVDRCNNGTGTTVIDPSTNKTVSQSSGHDHPAGVLVSGHLWSSTDAGILTEYDPVTLRPLRSVRTPAFETPVPGGGRLWLQGVTDTGDDTGTIMEVDPGTARLVSQFKVGGETGLMEPMSYAAGALWLVDGTRKALLRIDTVTHTVRAYPIPGYKQFSNYFWGVVIAVSGNDLFFRSAPGQVAEFDVTPGRIVRSYPDDPNAGGGGIGVGFGALWEANFMSDTVWRVPIG